MTWTLANFALATAIVTFGALLQAASGLGAGLIIVPLLTALISTDLVPGPMIFASIALSAVMMVRGWQDINFRMTPQLFVGIVAGTVVAAWFIANVPRESLGLVFGIGVLIAVGLTLRAPKFSLTPGGMFTAGLLAALLGVSVGIGAPILALLYQHFPGPALRATLAYIYFVSSIIGLVFLHFVGRFGEQDLISGLYLIPGFIAGYILSPQLVRLVDRGNARPLVLTISIAGAVFLIWTSVS